MPVPGGALPPGMAWQGGGGHACVGTGTEGWAFTSAWQGGGGCAHVGEGAGRTVFTFAWREGGSRASGECPAIAQ